MIIVGPFQMRIFWCDSVTAEMLQGGHTQRMLQTVQVHNLAKLVLVFYYKALKSVSSLNYGGNFQFPL